jgi:hypothetical protein
MVRWWHHMPEWSIKKVAEGLVEQRLDCWLGYEGRGVVDTAVFV